MRATQYLRFVGPCTLVEVNKNRLIDNNLYQTFFSGCTEEQINNRSRSSLTQSKTRTTLRYGHKKSQWCKWMYSLHVGHESKLVRVDIIRRVLLLGGLFADGA